MKKILVIVSCFVFFLSCFLLEKEKVSALSCMEPKSPREEYRQSDLVVHGYVEKYQYQQFTGTGKYTITTKKIFKGTLKEEKWVGYDSTGMWLEETIREKGEYLIYATYNKKEKKYMISPCGRTKEWTQGKMEIKKFPKSEVHKTEQRNVKQKETKQNSNPKNNIDGWVVLIGLFIVLSFAFIAIYIRKEKK